MDREPNSVEGPQSKGALGELLRRSDQASIGDTYDTAESLRLLQRAVRNGWGIDQDAAKKRATVERVMTVIGRSDVDDPKLQAKLDANAVRAAAVLVSMDEKDQTDYWNADKNARLDAGKLTENVAFTPPPVNQLPLPSKLLEQMDGG
jgi:hypothetical protein